MATNSLLEENINWGIKVLGDMISIPTVNPPGEYYWEFVNYSKKILESIGFKTEILEVPREYVEKYYPEYADHPRYIILSRYSSSRPVFHFNGHYDVVPAGSGWSKKPFEPVIEDNRIYGRGSSDMKGGIAAFLVAAKTLIETTRDINGTIEIALVPDEEIGGETGSGYLTKITGIKPDYAIIGEPSSSNTMWIGHKGALWAIVEVHGRQAHGSTPWLGVNAFEYMVKIAHRLINEYILLLDSRKSKYEYDDPRGAKPTATIGGELKGGAKINIVPGYCSFSIDRRIVPDEKLEDVERELVEFLERTVSEYRDVKVNIKIINRLKPALVDPELDFIKLIKKTVVEAIGLEPKTTICIGGLDMHYYTDTGIPVVTYGPGHLGVAHTADEYLSLSEFRNMSKIYYALLKKIVT